MTLQRYFCQNLKSRIKRAVAWDKHNLHVLSTYFSSRYTPFQVCSVLFFVRPFNILVHITPYRVDMLFLGIRRLNDVHKCLYIHIQITETLHHHKEGFGCGWTIVTHPTAEAE